MSTVDYSDLGEPIRGPSALTGDWPRFWHLTFTIARTEFKLRFYGSVLGYVWTVMRPLLMFGVLMVVYSLGKLGSGVHDYPVMLLSGIVLFTFFTEATAGAVACVVARESFVRKIQFPRLAIPLAVVLTALFNLAVNFIPIAIFTAIYGIRPRASWLELPLIVVILIIFAMGWAMLLSALYVRARDIAPIWDVLIQVLFYISLLLIPIEKIGAHGRTLLHIWMLNPLADLMEQYRHAFIGQNSPVPPTSPYPGWHFGGSSAAAAIGGYPELAVPMAFIVLVFVVGFVVFNRSAPHIADNL
ncbi:MAG: ABC transporter permease [Solirubrobacteraceae bacterium]|jgi:ABC-2 type transport system permease protein